MNLLRDRPAPTLSRCFVFEKGQTMNEDDKKQPPDPTTDARRKSYELHIGALVDEDKEATIIHAGERYRLRITSNNRLILTK
jgi:hemin uptake protein HemP